MGGTLTRTNSAAWRSAYASVELLHEDARTSIHRAVRTTDGRAVLLKVARTGGRRVEEGLRNEYEIAGALDVGTVLRPLALDQLRGSVALVLEDFAGLPLDRLTAGPMRTETFLELAVRIASALADVHERGVVHRDLKPSNILFDPATLDVKIADFGIATRVMREHRAPRAEGLIEGSLAYMAPEQTGRMNRAIDTRSDLYSLGVTFYQLLAGRLPFSAADPLEWVHSHVARAPAPLAEPGIPDVLTRIVLKLLAKLAEDRYQTARGLQHDLELCLARWKATATIESFPIGERDVSDRFRIPQKLYGRAEQLGTLLQAFDRVIDTGAPELLVVAGHAGIGKSALVNELQKPIVQQRGFFLSGKFDQFIRDIPYYTVAQAFRGLVLEMLGESEESVATWRQKLTVALGARAQLVIDLIPEVELIIGKQPAVPALPPSDAERRFHTVFASFLGVFARKDHPVALFLDDLQWVDTASLQLLIHVLADRNVRHLFVVGAYRDEEIHPSHPLVAALEEMSRQGVTVRRISLGPLSPADMARLVADTVRRPVKEASTLAQLVLEKTAGNPFFTIQFLTTLHQDGLLLFERSAGVWTWDLAKIRGRGFTYNVVELMVAKIERFSAAAQDCIRLAACAGNTFDVQTIAALHGESEASTHACLWDAAREGLILRLGDTYRFLHDRVRQAAAGMLADARRREIHLQIGRLLLATTPEARLEQRMFDIVAHFEAGGAECLEVVEARRVAELRLRAGRRAKSSAAYGAAARYFAGAIALLGPRAWEEQYGLALPLHVEQAECEWLTGRFDESERLASEAVHRAQSPREKAGAYLVLIRLHSFRGRNDRALDLGLECLRTFGIDFRRAPSPEDVMAAVRRVWQAIGDRPIEALLDLPLMEDADALAAMEIMTAIAAPAFFEDNPLYVQVHAHMTRLSIERGNSKDACQAYCTFGVVLGTSFGELDKGYRFGRLACDLFDKHSFFATKALTLMTFASMVNLWTRPLDSSISLLETALEAGTASGDLTFACYSCSQALLLRGARGERLESLDQVAQQYEDFVGRANYRDIQELIRIQRRQIQRLRGLPFEGPESPWEHGDYDQWATEAPMKLSVARYDVWMLEERFIAGDIEGALQSAARTEAMIQFSFAQLDQALYHFYTALALGRVADAEKAGDAEGPNTRALAQHSAVLHQLAAACPSTFGHKDSLVRAERARLGDRAPATDAQATRLYEESIRSAREYGFIQCEAIANELAAEFYRERGFETIAFAYLREARDCYARWGADAKVRDLGRLHPRLLEVRSPTLTSTLAVRLEQLDLLSVVKASQAISSEIQLDELARMLLRIVMEQAGAQRGVLTLVRDGALSADAEGLVSEGKIATRMLGSLPLSAAIVPLSIVQAVRRRKERVILDDASSEQGAFAADEYLARVKPRSVLCLPIVRQAEVVGLLYLEHAEAPGVFTEDRLVALELLASQAAISLANAMLMVREKSAREAAEREKVRSAFVAEAGSVLAEGLDASETLARLARLAVRSLADWCCIDRVAGEVIERAAATQADPAKEPLMAALQQLFPPRWDWPLSVARALRTREPVLVADVMQEDLRAGIADADQRRLATDLGLSSAMAVPLVARGALFGVMYLASVAPDRRYDESDLALARELADRAALALDNASLYGEVQRAVGQRDEFLTVASHELRTPMMSLNLALESMVPRGSNPPLPPDKLAAMIANALRQGRRLTSLVDNLLDVSRIELGRLPLEVTEVDLAELIRETIARFEPDLERFHCAISLETPSTPVIGRWDRSRIDQVVSNLLANAIKFAPGMPIEIEVGSEGDDARFSIRDHGIGIQPDQQKLIFQRFHRGVSSRHYGGLGLGLYISKRIVAAHGGRISLRSEVGSGTTFIIELPRSGPPKTGIPGPA